MPNKRRPLGHAPEVPEEKSDEASTPDGRDLQNADALAEVSPVLSALWNAKDYAAKDRG